MTISWQVQQQILAAQSPSVARLSNIADDSLRRQLYGFAASQSPRASRKAPRRASHWTVEEHERFLQGLELFPSGPWKEVAAVVGTKTTRQTMTHAQKYRQKMERRIKLAKNLQEMAKDVAPEPHQILPLNNASPLSGDGMGHFYDTLAGAAMDGGWVDDSSSTGASDSSDPFLDEFLHLRVIV